MSGGRRKRGGGSKLQWIGIVVGLLVVLLLAANLLKGMLPMWFEDADDPQGFLTKENFVAAAYWIPVGSGIVLALLGMFWATRAYAKHDSRSVLWLRRVLVAGFVALAGLIGATFDPETFDREALAVVAGWALFLALAPAVIGAWRNYSRGGHHHGGGGGGKRKRKRKNMSSTHTLPEREGAEVDA